MSLTPRHVSVVHRIREDLDERQRSPEPLKLVVAGGPLLFPQALSFDLAANPERSLQEEATERGKGICVNSHL